MLAGVLNGSGSTGVVAIEEIRREASGTLLEIANDRGFVTAAEVMSVLEEADERPESLDVAVDVLGRAGVVIREDPVGLLSADEVLSLAAEGEQAIVESYLDETERLRESIPSQDIERISTLIQAGRRAQLKLDTSQKRQARRREALERRVEEGDEATKRLMAANLWLSPSVAAAFAGDDYSLMDLIQPGNRGLLGAVEHFSYHSGLRFSTYATWWIRRAIAEETSKGPPFGKEADLLRGITDEGDP